MGKGPVDQARSRMPRRYRLAPRKFEFRLIEDKLIEVNTGLQTVSSTGGYVIGQAPPAVGAETRNRVYLHTDGTPADSRSEFLLRRDMTDYLCVLLCRMRPDPLPQDERPDDLWKWETILAEAGMPADLPPSIEALSRHPRHERPQRDHLLFVGYAPSHLHRAVVRRLSLIFQRPQSDRLLTTMAEYFCRTRGRKRWKWDPELEPLAQQYEANERIRRLIGVLGMLAGRRSSAKRRREWERSRSFRYEARIKFGKFVFVFPATTGLRGSAIDNQRDVEKLLQEIWPYLWPTPFFDVRWLAVAVYVAREYLETPKRLARLDLTQKRVAHEFGLTRRQLTHALQQAKRPGFNRQVIEYLERRPSAHS